MIKSVFWYISYGRKLRNYGTKKSYTILSFKNDSPLALFVDTLRKKNRLLFGLFERCSQFIY